MAPDEGGDEGRLGIPWGRPGMLLFFLLAGIGPALAMVLRFVPAHLDALGASPSTIGEVMSVSTLGSLVALPFAGHLADRWPRLALVAGAILQGLGLGIVGAFASAPLGLAAGVGVMSVGTSLVDVTVVATLAAAVGPRGRAIALAYYFVLLNFSRNIVGSSAAEGLIAAIGFAEVGLLFAAAAGLHALVRLLAPLPGGAAKAAAERVSLGDFAGDLARPRSLIVLVVFLALAITFCAQESFLSALASSRELGPVSPFYIAYFAVIVSGRLSLARAIDRIGRGRVIVGSAALLAATMIGLAHVTSTVAFIALGALSGAGHFLLWPALYAAVYAKIRGPGMVTALLGGVMAAAGFVAELGLGGAADAIGYQGLYLAAAAFAVLALALALTQGRRLDLQAEAAAAEA